MAKKYYQTGGEVEEDEEEVVSGLAGISPEDLRSMVPSLETYRTNSAEIREALKAARERIAGRPTMDRADFFLALSQGLGTPTRTGAFGETAANVSQALAGPLGASRELERQKEQDLLGIDEALLGIDETLMGGELDLARIQAQLRQGAGSSIPARLRSILMAAQAGNWTEEQLQEAIDKEFFLRSKPGQARIVVKEGVPYWEMMGSDPEGNAVPLSMPLSSQAGELAFTQAVESSEKIGQALGEQYSTMQEGIPAAMRTIQNLDVIRDLLEGRDTGRLTPIITEIGGYLSNLGINIIPGQSEFEAADAIAKGLALQSRNPMSGGGMPGHLSDQDRRFLAMMNPNIAQTPGGRDLLIEITRRLVERDIQVAQLAREYRTMTGGRFDEYFYDYLAEWAERTPLFTEADRDRLNLVQRETMELSPDQEAELQRIMEEEGLVFRRGGRVRRRYQSGGRVERREDGVLVVTLSDGTRVAVYADGSRRILGREDGLDRAPPRRTAESEGDQDTGISSLKDLASELIPDWLPSAMSVVGGGLGGLGAEAALAQVEKRVRVPRAERDLIRAIEKQGLDPIQEAGEIKRARKMGIPAILGDIRAQEARGTMARALGVGGAEAGKTMEFLESRQAGARDRVLEQANKAIKPDDYFEQRDRFEASADPEDKVLLDAMNQGRRFTRMRPQEMKKALNNMTFMEKDAFRTGVFQRLSELIEDPVQNINPAAQILGSKTRTAQLKTLFDSDREWKLFEEALKKEAEIFDSSKRALQTGDTLRSARQSGIATTSDVARAAIAPIGWAVRPGPIAWVLRVIRAIPNMTPKNADRALQVLRKGDPKEMDEFIRRAETYRRLRGRRSGRRAAAGALGIGAAALLGRDKEEEEEAE